jgi:hypothetical protein
MTPATIIINLTKNGQKKTKIEGNAMISQSFSPKTTF